MDDAKLVSRVVSGSGKDAAKGAACGHPCLPQSTDSARGITLAELRVLLRSEPPVGANNGLFRGGTFWPLPAAGSTWTLTDNLFDSCLVETGNATANNYNGYWYAGPASGAAYNSGYNFLGYYPGSHQGITYLSGGGPAANDVTLASAPLYQVGPLGNYYLPASQPLCNGGSQMAAQAGLYHYTTTIDQTKEASTIVDIGLHYVACYNGQPSDTDADGVPDYVEDANGNGIWDSPAETDWNNPNTYGATGGDAYDAVYDDMDLDGDGMVGRVEKALNRNPLLPDNPLTLTQIITGNEPNILTFEVPVNYNLLSSIGDLSLKLAGESATLDECDPASDGNSLVVWNATYDPPGQTLLQAQLTLNVAGGGQPVSWSVGVPLPFTPSSGLQFFVSDSSYNDSTAYLDAALPSQYNGQAVNYSIQLYDPSTSPSTLITTINDTTSNGFISEVWNLTYSDGVTHFGGPGFDAQYNVTSPPSAVTSATKHHYKLASTEQGNGFDFAYFYTPSNNSLVASFSQNSGAVWNGMLGVVNVLMMPNLAYTVYQSVFNHWDGDPQGAANPGHLDSRATVTGKLLPDMLNSDPNKGFLTKNFYCSGHGNGGWLQNYAANVYLAADDVGHGLGNHFGVFSGAKITNPYRFVWLDGCGTAATRRWQRAFGMCARDLAKVNGDSAIGAQAFVGWGGSFLSWLAGVGSAGSAEQADTAQAYTRTLLKFFSLWMQNNTLKTCLDNVTQVQSTYYDGWCPLPVQAFRNKTVIIKSQLGAFYSVPVKYVAPIYVIGHSGLYRGGWTQGDDGAYAQP